MLYKKLKFKTGWERAENRRRMFVEYHSSCCCMSFPRHRFATTQSPNNQPNTTAECISTLPRFLAYKTPCLCLCRKAEQQLMISINLWSNLFVRLSYFRFFPFEAFRSWFTLILYLIFVTHNSSTLV